MVVTPRHPAVHSVQGHTVDHATPGAAIDGGLARPVSTRRTSHFWILFLGSQWATAARGRIKPATRSRIKAAGGYRITKGK